MTLMNIYQMKEEHLHDYGFESLGFLREQGVEPHIGMYDLVRSEMVEFEDHPLTFLELQFTRFNVNRPEDFTGRSMSVSDVIELVDEDGLDVYYVNTIGFEKIDNFNEDKNWMIFFTSASGKEDYMTGKAPNKEILEFRFKEYNPDCTVRHICEELEEYEEDTVEITREEMNTVLAVFSELVRKPYNELNTYLGSETIKRMSALQSKLEHHDYCKERGIRYEDMTDDDFENAALSKYEG